LIVPEGDEFGKDYGDSTDEPMPRN